MTTQEPQGIKKALRLLLFNVIESGQFPEGNFDVHHIDRIYGIEDIGDNKVCFSIRRHPHLFGKPTRGEESSAMAIIEYVYKVDLKTSRIKKISSKLVSVSIDYNLLAKEDVNNYFTAHGGEKDAELSKLTMDEEVVKFAEDRFKELPQDFFDKYQIDLGYVGQGSEIQAEIPIDHMDKIKTAMKTAFVEELQSRWRFLKKEQEEEIKKQSK